VVTGERVRSVEPFVGSTVPERDRNTVALEFHRRRPERIAELLDLAGFVVRSRLVREPAAGERTAQAYLVARKPSGIDQGEADRVAPGCRRCAPSGRKRWHRLAELLTAS